MKSIGVIPARYKSVRFPGKPLALLGGKPLIQHVHERAGRSRLDRILVATDDLRIRTAAEQFGAEVIMTSPDAPSGTDRIIEAVAHLDCDIVVNIQGDEPFIDPRGIDECLDVLAECPDVGVATLAERIRDPKPLADPNVVKVVDDFEHNALYFSRSLIPYPRDLQMPEGGVDLEQAVRRMVFLKHVGLYAYRKSALEKFASLPPSPLEMIEKLEQLRILQSGSRIRIVEIESASINVDTPEDLTAAARWLEKQNGAQ